MVGTTIQHYTITRLIGEGGMASVYEAVHNKLQSKVAVKILNPILTANAGIRQRFENEARFMASLNHINITRVIDYEERPDMLAIILEFLEGEDMNVRIKRQGAMTLPETRKAFLQVLEAFEYAHSKSIVHRDVKPSNIFLEPSGVVKILDFGIAKLVGGTDEMTVTGAQIGTPVYMSPEQVNSDKSLDHRSDIYSLGVTLFYMLNGRPPYDASTASNFQIFTKIVYEPLPSLDQYPFIDTVIKQATHKDPASRFQSCAAFREAFEEAIDKTQQKSTTPSFADDEKTLIDIPEAASKGPAPVTPSPAPSTLRAMPKAEPLIPVNRDSLPLRPSGEGGRGDEGKSRSKSGDEGKTRSKSGDEGKSRSKSGDEGIARSKSKATLYTIVIAVFAIISITIKLFPGITGDLFLSSAKKAERQAEVKKILEYVETEWQKERGQMNKDSALVLLTRAIELDDENPSVWFYYCSARYLIATDDGVNLTRIDKEMISEISDAMEKVIKLDPNYKVPERFLDPYSNLTIFWGELALHYLNTGDKEAALDALKEGKKRGAFPDALLDYARNTMVHAGSNALLFNTDDLFYHGMLYVQLIDKYRTDLIPVNIGFFEQEWYFNYLTTKLNVQTSGYLDWYRSLKPETITTRQEQIETPEGNQFTWTLFPNNKGQLSVREQLLLDILKSNKFARPVCFSNYLNRDLLVSLGSYLRNDGWTLVLDPKISTFNADAEVYKLEKMNMTNIMGYKDPSPDFNARIDFLRYMYISFCNYLHANNQTEQLKTVKRLLTIGFPDYNFPIKDANVQREYNALVMKTELTEDQRRAKVSAEIAEYMEKNNLHGYTTADGIVFCEKFMGDGPMAAGHEVKATYIMKLLDGTEIFNSTAYPDIVTDLTTENYIKGFIKGASLMREGGQATFFIPYYLGYGDQTQATVPAYSTLVVEMEMVKVL